jgi:hypothetical protein
MSDLTLKDEVEEKPQPVKKVQAKKKVVAGGAVQTRQGFKAAMMLK